MFGEGGKGWLDRANRRREAGEAGEDEGSATSCAGVAQDGI